MARQWRTRRILRRNVYVLGALLVLLPLVAASQAAANHITLANPPSFTYKNDEACSKPNANLECPDDQPGQKDLSAHAVATPSQGDLWVSWKWDVTGLSGGNTGDACALFDTDNPADFKVNSALCLTISGDPANDTNTRVYRCGDDKVDRCTSPVTQVSPIHSICDVSQPANSDPFHANQADTVAVCHVNLPDLSVGGNAANLVNTCSYPSEQPNSDPSDCVLIPRDAFIQIVKNATPDNQGSFPFKLDGATTGIVFPTSQSNTATGDESSNTIAIKSGTPSHSVQELVPSGWDLTGATCTGASGSGTSNGTPDLATGTISGIIAASDNTVVCTFNDRKRASIDISKSGSDSGAQTGAVFTLYPGADTSGTPVGTCTVDANGDCGPSDPSFGNLVPGQYTIDETTVPNGYNKPGTLPQTVTLTAGQAFTVSYTDQAQPGSVTITKVDDAGAAVNGATFQLYSPQGISNGAPTGNAVSGKSCQTAGAGTCTISNVTPGLYTIDETVVPSGYAKDPNYPQNITVTNGTTLNLNAADPRQFKVIVLVCKKTDNTLYASKVSFDGDAVPASANSLGSPPSGLTNAQLCGLGGAVHDNVPKAHTGGADHTSTIRIP
jgi:Prealbumin-like fold domain